MKPILYSVAIVAACGAAFLSFTKSQKFKALESDRVETIATKKQTLADADVADTEIKKEKSLLAASQEKQELLTQSVSSLKSTGTSLANDLAKVNEDLKSQDEEYAQLEKALEEVNKILADLGGGVTLDTLPDKIQQIDDDKKAKQTKLEELEVLVGGAEKSLATSSAELDRLTKRMIERNVRIGRNSMDAVVTAVNQDWGFLVIGAGSNSGFTPQTGLLVERDGRKIGRVRPSAIEPTQTIAEIDLGSLSSGVRLQPGDRVILAQPVAN
jgi:predicted RNase H-like nuclease (RuvC/YqgF family)